MKFGRELRPATETSSVVLYGGKTIPRWRTAAILKIDISPNLSKKSSNFHDILYTAADFELDERHVIKMKKLHWTDSEFDRTYFLSFFYFSLVSVQFLKTRIRFGMSLVRFGSKTQFSSHSIVIYYSCNSKCYSDSG